MNIAGKQRCTTFRVKWKTGYGYLVFNPFLWNLDIFISLQRVTYMPRNETNLIAVSLGNHM